MDENGNIHIDQGYVKHVLQDLVRINSVNPSLSNAGPGEGAAAAYTAQALSDLGLDVTHYEVEVGRPNVVGRLAGAGTSDGRSLLLNAHLDTVGVTGMDIDPFDPIVRDGKLYGRGSQDMKSGLTAMLAATKALVDAGITLGGDLLVSGVSDEEYKSIGAADLVTRPEFVADGCIVTEPTDLAICRAHRGFIWFEVETFGRAAHGSRYKDGIDANMRMGRFLGALEGLEKELRHRQPHPLAGPPSLHAASLAGGTEISTYAAHCLCRIERRTIPGETVPQASAELQMLLADLAAADSTFKSQLAAVFDREPFEVAEDAAIVEKVVAAAGKQLGQAPPHVGQTFWTDAALFAAAGMETMLIGPTGAGLHGATEWVELSSVVDLAAILAETAVGYCGLG